MSVNANEQGKNKKFAALEADVKKLDAAHGKLSSTNVLEKMIGDVYIGRIALVSSFGTEAALLLSLVAEIDKNTPVIFLDTLKHFRDTLQYRDQLIENLGLTDVRSVKPDFSFLKEKDPEGKLWSTNPDMCCHIRKVLPLEKALSGFDAWITGRKRIHGGLRKSLTMFDHDDKRIKINPLAYWTDAEIDAEWEKRDLPEHPLVQWGYTSVGCEPCTSKTKPGEGKRSGRWTKFDKQECGIHLLENAYDNIGDSI